MNVTRSAFMLAISAVAAFAACTTPPDVGEETPLEDEFAGAPAWVTQSCRTYWSEEELGRICGVGSAGGSRNISLMRSAAVGRGRTDIARTLNVRVEAILADYAATTSGGAEFGEVANDEQHIVDVSRQVSELTLTGTELTDTWISPRGTYYALVSLEAEKFSEAVSRMDQLSEPVRQAIVDRADEAFAELDEEADRQ